MSNEAMPRTLLKRRVEVQRVGDYWRGKFYAMGSPCEVLVRSRKKTKASKIALAVADEAWRVEDKFSRYKSGNIIDRINASNGLAIEVDEETASLLNFADALHEMSDGRFDITSGCLRAAWTFDGSDNIPDESVVANALKNVGWHKIRWNQPIIELGPSMQIDFGGIGKEYAVDRAASLVKEQGVDGCLVNFGGDLVAIGGDTSSAWRVGIEKLDQLTDLPERLIQISHGGLATSGDARRYLLKDGVRYGHVLDCTTGWPVKDAPRSVTVAADSCTQAGMLATLAVLRGADAESFLETQTIQHWCVR